MWKAGFKANASLFHGSSKLWNRLNLVRVPMSIDKSQIQESHLKKLSLIQNKASQIQQSSHVKLWKLTSFPAVPEFYENREKLKDILWDDLKPLLKSSTETEYFKEYIKEFRRPPGEAFNVVSLLSSFGGGDLVCNNGDRVPLHHGAFKGKYVLVCCFHVPVLLGTWDFQSLVYLCHELYSRRDDFEMVVVGRMSSLANDAEVFEHFFSNFHESCLAVPFEDNQRRDYICKVLGLGSKHDSFECLLLNPEGVVLPTMDHRRYYEGELFPFTKDILDRDRKEVYDMIKEKKVSLERILRCNDCSPDFVYRFNPEGMVEKKSISELSNEVRNNKHVGLYVCSKGYFIPNLVDMYNKCREKQLEFEIVVVYLPFEEFSLNHFQREIDGLLEEHNVRSSWWCLPFNNSVSWRLFKLTEHHWDGDSVYDYEDYDKVMVVGPKVDHLDVYGANVMYNNGIDAYPFTIEAAIEVRKKQLREITLESLFIDGASVFRGNDRSDCRQVPRLFNGKKIMVCVDTLEDYDDGYDFIQFKTLISYYNEMKAKMGTGFEMVFIKVCDESVEENDTHRILSEMPWYICPKHGINSRNLGKLGELSGWPCGKGFEGLIGFGEDGHICSHYRKDLLESGKCIPMSDGGYRIELNEFTFGATLDRDVEVILGYDSFRRVNSSIIRY